DIDTHAVARLVEGFVRLQRDLELRQDILSHVDGQRALGVADGTGDGVGALVDLAGERAIDGGDAVLARLLALLENDVLLRVADGGRRIRLARRAPGRGAQARGRA